MTRSFRLLQIIGIPLLLAYGGGIIYVLFLSNILDMPVQSLPLIFWIFALLAPLLVLGQLVLYRSMAAVRLVAAKSYYKLELIGGLSILITAIHQSFEAPYLRGWHVFVAAAGVGAVLDALATWRLRRDLSRPGEPLDPPSPWTYMP
jgi:hypothetical protein